MSDVDQKKTILSIDDDPIIQRLFGGWLSKAGYNVVYAHSGHEGRELARRYHPDAILIDIRMPGDEDGFKTALRLKEEAETKDTPISLLSSEDLTYETEKAVKELGVRYMHKGVGEDEFLKQIREMTG